MISRVVFDTNVLISAALLPQSISGRTVYPCTYGISVLFSNETFAELREVLRRPKFNAYLSSESRHEFLHFLLAYSERVLTHSTITVCRDPKDNKFLEVALDGKADCIVTGDADLLVLNPFQGITIVTPPDFLSRFLSC